MALLQVNWLSEQLMRCVTMQVVLPVDECPKPGAKKPSAGPFPTLYLLHGLYGNCTDWISGTNIQRWAEEKHIAVVMPSGDNSFYLDGPNGYENYSKFIGVELVESTRRMFRLSEKREDTYIGGLSMGGYGAIINGLRYHNTFGRILGFSSALITKYFSDRDFDDSYILSNRDYLKSWFGDVSKTKGSDKDPWALVKKLTDEGVDIPKFYMACGESDDLLPVNDDYADYLKSLNVDITYEKGPGIHEWDFWHTYIKRALDWLP